MTYILIINQAQVIIGKIVIRHGKQNILINTKRSHTVNIINSMSDVSIPNIIKYFCLKMRSENYESRKNKKDHSACDVCNYLDHDNIHSDISHAAVRFQDVCRTAESRHPPKAMLSDGLFFVRRTETGYLKTGPVCAAAER